MDMNFEDDDRCKQNGGQLEESSVESLRILSTCDYICEEQQHLSTTNVKESTVLNNDECVDLDESLDTLIMHKKTHDDGVLSTDLELRRRSRRTRSKNQKYTLDQLLHEHEEEERKRLNQKDQNKFLDELEKEIEMAEKNTQFFQEELFEGQKELDRVLGQVSNLPKVEVVALTIRQPQRLSLRKISVNELATCEHLVGGDPMVALQTGLLELNFSLSSQCPQFLAEWLISCICSVFDVDLVVRAYRIVESLFISSIHSMNRFPFLLTYEHIVTFFTNFGADLQSPPTLQTLPMDESEESGEKQLDKIFSFSSFPIINFEYFLKVIELWLSHRYHTLDYTHYLKFLGILYRLLLDPITQQVTAQIQKCLQCLFDTFPKSPLPLEQVAHLIHYPDCLSLSLKCIQLTPISSLQSPTLQVQLAQHILQIITGKNIVSQSPEVSIISRLTALGQSSQIRQETDYQRLAVIIQLMDLSLHIDINEIDKYIHQLNEFRLTLVHLNNRKFRETKGYNWQLTKVKDLLINLSSKITLLINAYSRTKTPSLQSKLDPFFSMSQNITNKN